jgi:hypothetical protein
MPRERARRLGGCVGTCDTNEAVMRRSRRARIVKNVAGPGQLLFRVIALVALLVGGVVATVLTHSWWLLVVTVAALVAAAAAVAFSVNAMLGQDDGTESPERHRGLVAVVAVVAVVALALAVALPIEASSAVSTAAPNAAGAAATVRAFLASAILDANAYAACQYLAPSEQQQVADLAGDGQTCRAALAATESSIPGVHSEGSLHALQLHAVVRAGTAVVMGRSPLAFALRPATAAETSAYKAPSAGWRIVSGATSVLTQAASAGRSGPAS